MNLSQGGDTQLVLALIGLVWGIVLIFCAFAVLRLPGYMRRQERRADETLVLLRDVLKVLSRGAPAAGDDSNLAADPDSGERWSITCPKCAAPLIVVAGVAKARCPGCGNVFDVHTGRR